MISYQEALAIVADNVDLIGESSVPIENAAGSVTASEVVSGINVCPFRNSAMDGFAVSSASLKSIPVTLTIAGTIYAGDNHHNSAECTSAVKVMTGAPVPDQFDTVVRFEDTEYDANHVTITEAIKAGANVRMPGEDIAEGDRILSAGESIHPLHTGILASIGLDKVRVYKKPRVIVIGTGNEVIAPGQPLKPGQVYNSNSYSIASMIGPFCSEMKVIHSVSDDSDSLRSVLDNDFDVIVTSGGVSAGERDLLPGVAGEVGFESLFHKVSIKPGKPILFARRNKQLLFGLPGNPLSTVVTCATFVLPALKKMIGIDRYMIEKLPALLSADSVRKSGRTVIWPGKIIEIGSELRAEYSPQKSSAALSAVMNSDGLIFQTASGEENQTPLIEVARWHQILGN